MSRKQENDDAGAGCGCLLAIVAIAAVVAAAMSLAALVDPFDWYPSFEAVWAECDDDYDTARDECSYEHRFPGFWWHLVVNLTYAVGVGLALLIFAATVGELRERRAGRLSNAGTYASYRAARASVGASASVVALLAALPILVALV